MSLYTFVFVISDGIYVSQFSGSTIHSALKIWANSLSMDQGVTDAGKRSIEKDLAEETQFREMDEMKNVWCTTVRNGSEFGFVHVVKTEK